MKRSLFFLCCLTAFFLYGGRVVVYNTTDMHGQALPGKGKTGGYLALTEKIRSLREKEGVDRTVYIDCGDLFQGTMDSFAEKGKSSVQALNRAGCDVWIPGNHDFEYTIPVLKERVREFHGTFLAANLAFSRGKSPAGWIMLNRGGMKIAVIGLTTQFLDTWLFDLPGKGIAVSDMKTALERVMPEVMRAHPDAVILALHAGQYAAKRFHGGFRLDAILKDYPQIDLVLGGHSHETVPGIRLHRSGICFAQAGRKAGGFIRAVIETKPDGGGNIVSTEYIALTEADRPPRDVIPFHAENKTVTKHAPAFGPAVPGSGTDVMFDRAIRKGFPEAVLVFHGFLSRSSTQAGKLRQSDVFRHCPYENTVVLARITPDQARRIIEEQESLAPESRQTVFGVKKDPNGTLVLSDGRIWKEGRLTAAFNSFAAASAGMRYPVMKSVLADPACNAKDTGILIRELLENYLKGL